MKSFQKTILRILAPLLFAICLCLFLSVTEYESAILHTRIKIEWLILGVGVLLSLVILIAALSNYRFRAHADSIRHKFELHHSEEHRRFIRRLDHELKNPLLALQLGIENLSLTEENAKTYHDLKEQVQRLSRLTKELRKITAIDEHHLEDENVDVEALLKDVHAMALEHPNASDRSIQLNLPAAPWPVPNIIADHDLLLLALYNLIENAIKYSREGDSIEIRASDDQFHVTITISDTGLGINEDELELVKEELYRGNNADHEIGTGIGLSLANKIIERHHGTLSISSKLGVGTRVVVKLKL